MTERVIQNEHSERVVYGGSGLWEFCMKTIPELCAEEAKCKYNGINVGIDQVGFEIVFEALPCCCVISKE